MVACGHEPNDFVQLSRLSARQYLFQVSPNPAAISKTKSTASAEKVTNLESPELRYLILSHFEGVFFCDPEASPVGLSPDLAKRRAMEKFPDIQQDQDTFRAILNHLGIKESATLSDEQKLLIYREFNKLRGAVRLETLHDQVRFNVGLKQKTGDVSVDGSIDRHGVIKILKRERTVFICPKCLGANTKIETLIGPVQITNLKKGMIVWTSDVSGNRVAAPILVVSAIVVAPHQLLTHLMFEDGRELLVSPQHPTLDGRVVGQLSAGDIYNGSVVQSAELVGYKGVKTYDLLPAGETGFYWANRILLASTLR